VGIYPINGCIITGHALRKVELIFTLLSTMEGSDKSGCSLK